MKDRRLPYKFFKKMAAGLPAAKTPTQCRTHHQKMMLKYKTWENIIEAGLGKSEDTTNCVKKEEMSELVNSIRPPEVKIE